MKLYLYNFTKKGVYSIFFPRKKGSILYFFEQEGGLCGIFMMNIGA